MNIQRLFKGTGIFLFSLLFFSCSYFFCTHPFSVFFYSLIIFLCTHEILRHSSRSILYSACFTSVSFITVNIIFLSVAIGKVPIKTAYAAFDRPILLRHAAFIRDQGFVLLLMVALSIIMGIGVIKILEKRKKFLPVLILPCLAGAFVATALTYDPSFLQIIKTKPAKDISIHDTLKFTRMFYLMKEGKGYYYSLGTENTDLSKVKKTEIIYWRPPTLFTFWSIVLPANALYIFYLYLLFSVLAAFLGYRLLEDLAGFPLSILGVQLLFAFYMKGIVCLWYNNFEIWGGFFVVAALYFVVRGKQGTALSLFLVALFIRELFVIALMLHMIYLFVTGKKKLLLLALGGILGYAVFYLIHFHHMHQFFEARGIPLGWSVSGRLQSWDFMFFLRTIQFGGSFIVGHFWMSSLICMLSIGGMVCLKKDAPTRLFLAGIVAVPLIMFLFIGTFYNDYWGGMYLPEAFLLAPTGLGLFIPRLEGNG